MHVRVCVCGACCGVCGSIFVNHSFDLSTNYAFVRFLLLMCHYNAVICAYVRCAGDRWVLYVTAKETLLCVKMKLFVQHCVPVQQQRILFAGRELSDSDTCEQQHIVLDSILHMVVRPLKAP